MALNDELEALSATHRSPTSAANRRGHVRVKPDACNGLSATLSNGSAVKLIDLSRGGAQFQSERRFVPNAPLTLRLKTPAGQVQASATVVRSRIIQVAGGALGYVVAVAFANPLTTDLECQDVEAASCEQTSPRGQDELDTVRFD
jgi:hypothetical protein